MSTHQQILDLIYNALDQLNATLKPAEAVVRSPETVLMGEDGALDSMAFVTFMAALEEALARKRGLQIDLIDVFFGTDADRWTVEDLAARLAERAPSRPTCSEAG